MPNDKPSNKPPQPKEDSEFFSRLAELCKKSGVPHYTVDNPHPHTAAIIDEIFGSGPVLFTPLTPSSKKPQDNAHEEEDDDD